MRLRIILQKCVGFLASVRCAVIFTPHAGVFPAVWGIEVSMSTIHTATRGLNSGVEQSAWMRCAFVQGKPGTLELVGKYDGGWTS